MMTGASATPAAICAGPVAVVVANSDYGKLKLNNPRKDADVVQRALERVGYKVHRGDHLTAAQIMTLVPAGTIKRCGTSVLYFAGHGVQISGRTYIAGTDFTDASGVEEPGGLVALDDLARKLAATADRIYLFFDASRPKLDRKPAGEAVSPAALFSGIAALKVVAFAAGGDQEPLDVDPTYTDNGPFARALAASIDLDWPDIDSVLLHVRQRVQRITNGSQVPDWYRAPDAALSEKSDAR